MKKILKIAGLVLLVLIVCGLAAGYWLARPIGAVATGYAAKILCSAVYVSGRSYDSVMAEDLAQTANYKVKARLDRDDQAAEASMLGLFPARAVFRPGLGCALISGTDGENLRAAGRAAVRTEIGGEASWPLEPGSPPASVDEAKMAAALDEAFAENAADGKKLTRAVVVVHRGRVVGERYAPGVAADTPLLGWSMTKSITNALVGVLVGQGKLDISQPAAVPEWQSPGDPRREITLDQLLRMESGLKFVEEYDENLKADCPTMLFDAPDAAAYAASLELEAPPGSRWSYSSGTTNIVSRLARQASGLDYDQWLLFPRQALFDPLGMYGAVLETDAAGNFVGSSFGYAPARDWARFGWFYLRDGVWNGRRILPEGWVEYSRTRTPHSPPEKAYGAHFWLNTKTEKQWLPFVPDDMFAARGYEGQCVMIIPSRELVVVRLGLSHGPTTGEILGFVRSVLEALPQG